MKILAGWLLLPFCAAATWTVAQILPAVTVRGGSPSGIGFCAGAALWLVLFLGLPRPVKAYVFAHEFTHMLWGWLMGARISRFRVSARGGSVTLSKSNFLITLAPYFFPLYTLAVVAAYGLISLFKDLRPYAPLWTGFIGLTWSFHLTFTITTLRRRQPDLEVHGRLFSLALIWLLNVLGVGLGLVVVGPPTLVEFTGRLGANVLGLWQAMGRWGLRLWGALQGHLAARGRAP